MDYDSVKQLHQTLPAFTPAIPVSALPNIAFVLLTTTFGLAFYFTTLSKDTVPIREVGVGLTASVLGGFGVVALFCAAGVYV